MCESSVSFYKLVRILTVGEESTFWRGRAPLVESAPLWERAHPFGGGRAPLIQHTVSRWCSSGCVHKGCGGVDRWLQTDHWSSQIFFYRQPTRQASTKCPLPALKQLNFWMQISSQLSRFPNSNNDHCDLGFRVTAWDVVRRPYLGHEAATEDSMPKGVEGYMVPPWPWYEGGGWIS